MKVVPARRNLPIPDEDPERANKEEAGPRPVPTASVPPLKPPGSKSGQALRGPAQSLSSNKTLIEVQTSDQCPEQSPRRSPNSECTTRPLQTCHEFRTDIRRQALTPSQMPFENDEALADSRRLMGRCSTRLRSQTAGTRCWERPGPRTRYPTMCER